MRDGRRARRRRNWGTAAAAAAAVVAIVIAGTALAQRAGRPQPRPQHAPANTADLALAHIVHGHRVAGRQDEIGAAPDLNSLSGAFVRTCE